MNGGRLIPVAALLLPFAWIAIAAADDASGTKTDTTTTPATAAPASAVEPVDPTGSWKWEYTFNDNPADFLLELNWDGNQLTGKYTAFNRTSDIEETKFENNQLSFISKREFNGAEFTVRFEGEAKPEEIVGTVAVDFGEGPREFEWNAKRVVDLAAVLGVWKLAVETPEGVVEPQITITKAGDKLHGDYVSPFGAREAKDVTFKNGELSWKIESDEDDELDFEVIYRGKPDGNKIVGSGDFDFGGNTGTMDFTGERTSDEKAATTVEPDSKSDATTEPAAANSDSK